MSAGPLAERAARLAAVVARLDDRDWSARVAGLAEGAPAPEVPPEPPTYREVATAGTAVVEALAEAGRWDEAVVEATELRRLFLRTPDELGPVAGQAFDGLLAASMARDREELDDFVGLVEALFP